MYINEFILRSEKVIILVKFILVLISLWVIYDGVKKDMILEVEIIYVDSKICRY